MLRGERRSLLYVAETSVQHSVLDTWQEKSEQPGMTVMSMFQSYTASFFYIRKKKVRSRERPRHRSFMSCTSITGAFNWTTSHPVASCTQELTVRICNLSLKSRHLMDQARKRRISLCDF